MWKTWNWETVRVKKHFSDVGQCYSKRFLWHRVCERHEIRKKKCLWQNPHVFPWTKPSKRARARIRGPREVKALDFEILNDFMFCVACEYRHCYLNIGVAWALHLEQAKYHKRVYVFSSNTDEEVTEKCLRLHVPSSPLSVAQCPWQSSRHSFGGSPCARNVSLRVPATINRNPNVLPPICYDFKSETLKQ